VFSSGFSEASSDQGQGGDTDDGDGASDDTYLGRQFDDSDDEDDEFMTQTADEPSFDGSVEVQIEEDIGPSVPTVGITNPESSVHAVEDGTQISSGPEDAHIRNIQPKLSHPSSPRNLDVALDKDEPDWMKLSAQPNAKGAVGPKKMRVVIRDVAYATYRAVLYYVSMNSITLLYNNRDLCITDLYGCHRLCSYIVVVLLNGSKEQDTNDGSDGTSTL